MRNREDQSDGFGRIKQNSRDAVSFWQLMTEHDGNSIAAAPFCTRIAAKRLEVGGPVL